MAPKPRIEHHFTGSNFVRDMVIGMSDGLTVPFALAAGLSSIANSTNIVITGGLAEIAAGLSEIVEAILRNQSTVLTVSSLVNDYCGISDICLSLPTALNQNGVEWVLPMALNHQETEALRRSAEVLRTAIEPLKLK